MDSKQANNTQVQVIRACLGGNGASLDSVVRRGLFEEMALDQALPVCEQPHMLLGTLSPEASVPERQVRV